MMNQAAGKEARLLEMITWSQLGIHNKPIGLLNVDGYYNYLKSLQLVAGLTLERDGEIRKAALNTLATARPRTCVMGNIPNSMIYRSVDQYPMADTVPRVLILHIDAPIYFTYAGYLRERNLEQIAMDKLVMMAYFKYSSLPNHFHHHVPQQQPDMSSVNSSTTLDTIHYYAPGDTDVAIQMQRPMQAAGNNNIQQMDGAPALLSWQAKIRRFERGIVGCGLRYAGWRG